MATTGDPDLATDNMVNDVGPEGRSYLGGPSEVAALITVVREIPNRSAIRAFGTPSAASLLINAQSSEVITLPSLNAHFSPPKLFNFRAPSTQRGCRLVQRSSASLNLKYSVTETGAGSPYK